MKNRKQGHEEINKDTRRKFFENKLSCCPFLITRRIIKTSNDNIVISFYRYTGKHSCGLHNMSNVNETVNAEVVAVFISESTVIEKEHGNDCS